VSDTPFDLDTLAGLIAERLAPLLRADPEQLLDRPALAERLGVAERTVSGMVARRELPEPLICTGGVTRWRWADVLKYLESRRGKTKRAGRGRYRREAVTD
jgi:predicted DNA-binding transcriptional regulator AlpA